MCSNIECRERINEWLLALPSDTLDLATPTDGIALLAIKTSKKRSLEEALTPPLSPHEPCTAPSVFRMADPTETTTPKKRRLVDLDATPRGPAEILAPADSASQTGSIATTSTRTSASRKSSPTKQLMSLELANDPLHFASLDILEIDPSAAPGLRDVYLDITAFASGVNVIPEDHRVT
ncbi:hypothetical protein ColLi_13390 [Colletotrichum liriopes]|uniref:Uncharacterized protein n=1 Tax=Colletotrichum liriopes TaxID=708192 RepID=A0AA37LZG7_9PEZI|nr:hypothetical protein ColLi_13390 [Colletotrichum liriopes]